MTRALDLCTLDWLRERLTGQHHAALSSYLRRRTPDLAARDDAAGFDVNHILDNGFRWSNDFANIHEESIRIFRAVPGVDPSIIWNHWKTNGLPGKEFVNKFRKVLSKNAEDPHSSWASTCMQVLNEMDVYDILVR